MALTVRISSVLRKGGHHDMCYFYLSIKEKGLKFFQALGEVTQCSQFDNSHSSIYTKILNKPFNIFFKKINILGNRRHRCQVCQVMLKLSLEIRINVLKCCSINTSINPLPEMAYNAYIPTIVLWITPPPCILE